MPLYIKIDCADNGRLYAWTNTTPDWREVTSNTYGLSIPAVLRKLAKKIATEAK